MINTNMVVGGVFSTNAFAHFYQRCQKVLQETESNCYKSAVDEIGVMFIVSGLVHDYGVAGLSSIRRNRKKRLIVARWHVPRSVWDGAEDRDIHRYLISSLQTALMACVTRLQKDGEAVGLAECREVVESIVEALRDELLLAP